MAWRLGEGQVWVGCLREERAGWSCRCVSVESVGQIGAAAARLCVCGAEAVAVLTLGAVVLGVLVGAGNVGTLAVER